jgi:hypothetical protein
LELNDDAELRARDGGAPLSGFGIKQTEIPNPGKSS